MGALSLFETPQGRLGALNPWTRVRRRVPFPSSATTSAVSRSRPTKDEAGRGRFVFEIVFSGGKRSFPS